MEDKNIHSFAPVPSVRDDALIEQSGLVWAAECTLAIAHEIGHCVADYEKSKTTEDASRLLKYVKELEAFASAFRRVIETRRREPGREQQ
jgi:hypothetical protein